MPDGEIEPTESPATWENVVAGKVKHLIGEVVGDDEYAEEGEAQEDVAHEISDEEHGDSRHGDSQR